MKKILICVLAIVMVISMAIPAVALAKLSAVWETQVPDLTKESAEVVTMHSAEDSLELSEDIQNLMLKAKAQLKDACPKGFGIKYFCYAEVIDTKESVSVTFEPIDHYEIIFMQYIDDAWVKMNHTVNEDATITVDGVVEAPFAVFTNDLFAAPSEGTSFASAGAKRAKLLPGLAKGAPETVLLYSTEDVLELSEEVQELMTEAKAKLKDTCPDGFAAKYFCYVEIVGSKSASAVFKYFDHEEIQFKQYVNGAWVERKVNVNKDAGITVSDLVAAPLAVFTK